MSAAIIAKKINVNHIGLEKKDYAGGKSTLCQGCGHDAVTTHIINAYYQMGIDPYTVAKMSGIGCSSKAPAYFMSQAFGFNGVHGRMPAIATGANMGNHHLHIIGVSGDGDTASIGMGQFVHNFRRNGRMVYICENNGVYGLTKGQFSATSDLESTMKVGINKYFPIDLCGLAVEMGCEFVARGYAGDAKQLLSLFKAAIAHNGLAFIDVISPCITFNNHDASTKSHKYVKGHDWVLDVLDFVPFFEERQVEYDEGETTHVEMPDGSHIYLKKLEKNYDPTNRNDASRIIREAEDKLQILTGLIYVNTKKPNFIETIDLGDTPMSHLPDDVARPSREVFDEIMRNLE